MMPSSGSAAKACRHSSAVSVRGSSPSSSRNSRTSTSRAAGAEGLDADVAAGRDAEVLGQLDGPYALGQRPGRGEPLPTTTTSIAVAVLLGDRVEQRAQLVGAVAHGDDDRSEPHRAAALT